MQGPPLPISTLESYLSYWLHYVGYRLSHELGRKTQKLGVTAAEWVFLRKLHENESMPSHLAARLGLTRSAISKLAKRLEAKALIHRTKSLLDGRAKLLKLTQLGRELVPSTRRERGSDRGAQFQSGGPGLPPERRTRHEVDRPA